MRKGPLHLRCRSGPTDRIRTRGLCCGGRRPGHLAAWILRRALCPQLDALLPLGALLLIPTAALYAELLFQKRRELAHSDRGTAAEAE
ncbi:MAG: hypothetical protein IK095_07580 [Oscillospiraceae bacterium]|nr:hypothetical protein [Oscillospiraceae bacterium]